jgi:hypothetical protein
MNRVLNFSLAFSVALAHVASAQTDARATTKQKSTTSATARAQSGTSLTLSNNPVTRAYHKVASAIGFGDSQSEKVVTPAPRKLASANNQNAESRAQSSAAAKPVTSRPASQPAASAPAASNPAANSKSAATPPTAMKPLTKAAAPAAKPAADTAPTVLINREVFAYEGAGRRDPFVSLLTTSDLKPLLQDLKLVGVAYDPRGQNSVAVLRDVTSKYDQYKVRVGQTIGRMRVAAIQPKAVIFTIEEFGYSRQELLPIAPPDSTKMRQR